MAFIATKDGHGGYLLDGTWRGLEVSASDLTAVPHRAIAADGDVYITGLLKSATGQTGAVWKNGKLHSAYYTAPLIQVVGGDLYAHVAVQNGYDELYKNGIKIPYPPVSEPAKVSVTALLISGGKLIFAGYRPDGHGSFDLNGLWTDAPLAYVSHNVGTTTDLVYVGLRQVGADKYERGYYRGGTWTPTPCPISVDQGWCDVYQAAKKDETDYAYWLDDRWIMLPGGIQYVSILVF